MFLFKKYRKNKSYFGVINTKLDFDLSLSLYMKWYHDFVYIWSTTFACTCAVSYYNKSLSTENHNICQSNGYLM